ncbi:MAG: hypothetical protein U5K73_00170 [Halofilum sp. (in: g-proteobacteria)]|nr:hypothetical protein [Halofilum sp. (in: g-proteobacteria)]
MRIEPPWILLAVALAALPAWAPAAEVPSFSRPDDATRALRARDLPFQLWYDPDEWTVGPRRSSFTLLARAVHEHGSVSGAFVYRAEPRSREQVRRRAVEELASAFASHEVRAFQRRLVNGHEVWFMKAVATTRGGTEVVVRNQYWLGPEGVADYGVVANRESFERYREDMLDLLNGFRLRPGDGQGS